MGEVFSLFVPLLVVVGMMAVSTVVLYVLRSNWALKRITTTAAIITSLLALSYTAILPWSTGSMGFQMKTGLASGFWFCLLPSMVCALLLIASNKKVYRIAKWLQFATLVMLAGIFMYWQTASETSWASATPVVGFWMAIVAQIVLAISIFLYPIELAEAEKS